MNNSESRLRPGEAIPEWDQYKLRTDRKDPQKEIGFKAPDGKFYHFRHGKTLAHQQQTPGSNDRKTIVILKDKTNVPVEEWMKSYEEYRDR